MMKKWLLGLFLIGFFVVSLEGLKVSADELNNHDPEDDKVFVKTGEKVILEDGKTFVLDNGVEITANKVTDNNNNEFNSKSIGINSTPPNGQWDYIGGSLFTNESHIFHSTGGDIRIDIFIDHFPSSLAIPYVFQLREQDTFSSYLVKQIEIKEHRRWEVSVRGLNDGSNGKSELFLRKLTYPSRSVYTEWYD
ncbi:hypothetical protein GMD78_00210 [Ornithinibacillus sp. L9]|uniref:Uncharacterized protein n=1 Tax=Ornithinibacillus caprae TaxID=2678566 RepID=A0A6N8FBV1_9BACI|nr:hypothetical protein [Ornithinibacillus caprae]MUK86825.1 hypothetical protein [Ornithinibacillus caprae]